MDLAEMRIALKSVHIATVASETRLSRQTVYNAMNDKCAKPTGATIKLLTDWLVMNAKRDAAKAKGRAK